MASLVVGGVTIPVAISSPAWTRSDAVDRGRLFDGTFFASEAGGATRDWNFSTTPVTQADADTYIAALSSPAAKLCSGDILQIPTMCSPELPSGKPTRAASSNRVVLDFMLHEIQPAKVLLRYAPGDTITGESFGRSTIASYFTSAGTLQDAAISVKRDAHYGPYPSGTVRMTLLEASRKNELEYPSDQSNAVWVKTSCSIGTGVAGMRGGTSACTVTATGANATVEQNLSASSSLARTNSVWIRRRTGTGTVQLADCGGTLTALSLTGTYQRVSVTTTSTTRSWFLKIVTSGDAVDIEHAQMEIGPFATSEISATTPAVTRGLETYTLPHTTPPQESTLYIKHVELGTLQSGSAGLVGIGASGNPSLFVFANGGFYTLRHLRSAPVDSTLAAAPGFGVVNELRAVLYGDGSVQLGQSIAGAAETVAAQSAPLALAAAWADLIVTLNDRGGVPGFTAIQSFKWVAGARSLAEMRAL